MNECYSNFKVNKGHLPESMCINELTLVTSKTFKKYIKYIENIFKSNITNGLIEGLNNKIKSIKRTAFGYSNFSNFKKRILIQAGILSISA